MGNFDETITDQQRWYQIGKECIEEPLHGISRNQALDQIGHKYGYAVSSLKRLMDYKNAIDRLRAVVPEAVPDILAGKRRLSLANAISLSHRPAEEIINVMDSLDDEGTKVTLIFPSRNNTAGNNVRTRRQIQPDEGDTSKEQRWYRIGKQCLEEREAGRTGLCRTSRQIGLEHDYAESSVRMFADYAKAIDLLQSKAPVVVPDILGGRLRLSLVNTATLSRKSPEEILRIAQFLSEPSNSVKEVFPGASHKPKEKKNAGHATVKDMPAYDPDAHVIGLAYTIPNWVSQIDNAFRITDFGTITVKAHRRLVSALDALKNIAETMLNILMEEPRDESKG